jgi:GTP-binding protein Era
MPQTPLEAAPDSILVGDVFMPWPFRQGTKMVRVAVLGTPNSGKSSLVNALTGTKVTAVSPKRNTTRMKTLGVCTRHDTQMVLYDTPGILELEGAKRYERDLTAEAWDATTRADVVLVLIDAVKRVGPAEHSLILKAKSWQQESKLPIVLVLNKCDLESPKSKLIETADELLEICDFNEVHYISASSGKFVDELQEYLFGLAKPETWQFPATEVTSLTELQRASEIIREKIYCRLNQDIPYGVTQLNEGWKDLPDGSLSISQRLLVETEVQQSILIGKKGAVINEIKSGAEKDLTSILGRRVALQLTVGVK